MTVSHLIISADIFDKLFIHKRLWQHCFFILKATGNPDLKNYSASLKATEIYFHLVLQKKLSKTEPNKKVIFCACPYFEGFVRTTLIGTYLRYFYILPRIFFLPYLSMFFAIYQIRCSVRKNDGIVLKLFLSCVVCRSTTPP